MSDLPEDLVEEILSRVPATSLKTLRYTCKRWNSLCNKRRFIRKHSDKAPKQLLILMLKDSRVCSMSVNLHDVPSVKVTLDVNLLDPRSNFDQFKISNISHSEGLLLFTNEDRTKIVVWNPCTGKTRWIPPPIKRSNSYALGSYQYNKYGDIRYKILCYVPCFGSFKFNYKFQIFEINSNSWRTLDVTLNCILKYNECGISLKRKTYWFVSDRKQLGKFLLSFDYTTERFELLHLPRLCPCYEAVYLSVLREEKLSVLLEHEDSSRTEIWVTNKIDETKLVSWSKILTVDMEPDLGYCDDLSFLVDEEKKVIVFCAINWRDDNKHMVYIFGEDNEVTQVDFGITTFDSADPFLFNYVLSLTQIQQGRSKLKKKRKRKRGVT